MNKPAKASPAKTAGKTPTPAAAAKDLPQHQKQQAEAKRESKKVALWTSLVALFVVALVAVGFYMRAQQKANANVSVYSDLGKVTATIGNTPRVVQTQMQLELKDEDGKDLIAERRKSVDIAVKDSFSAMEVDELYTIEGKKRLQKVIRKQVNKTLGKKVVKDVLFFNFVMDLG